jgi:magnesium transporter
VLPKALPDVNSRAGQLASPPPVLLHEMETVFEALARLRSDMGQRRVVHFYVTDSDGVLVGVAPVRRLLVSEPATLLGELMVHPVLSVKESDAFGRALGICAEHRLLALPVVDDNGRLTGVLEVSSAARALIELERRESTAGLFPSIGRLKGHSSGALVWGVAAGLVLAFLVAAFDGVLRRTPAVAFFIPAVMAVACASALPSIPLTGRRPRRFGELAASVWYGVAASAVAGMVVVFWLRMLPLAGVVAGSLAVTCAAGAGLGRAIPGLVHRRQPAGTASGPVVTAIAAVVALFFYLAVAALFL